MLHLIVSWNVLKAARWWDRGEARDIILQVNKNRAGDMTAHWSVLFLSVDRGEEKVTECIIMFSLQFVHKNL